MFALLTAAVVRPRLKDPDGETAAYAGFVLVRLGERDGLEPILAERRRSLEAGDAETFTSLSYRAIASLDDAAFVPQLVEIYEALRNQDYAWAVREFYWTIRAMHGPEILALRKRVRAEGGLAGLELK